MTETLAQALSRYTTDLDAQVASVVRAAAERVPAFAQRLAEAGLSGADVTGVGDLAALPVMTKDDVLALQRRHPPLGGLLAADAEVRRLFQSPGPIYEPQLAGDDPWRWSEALRSLGVGAPDVVLNCFGYHLSPAGAMFDEAVLALGARVVPAGVGALGLQATCVADLAVSAYVGLPSYLKALVEAYDQGGHDTNDWRVSRALVTAEPLPESLRSLLEARVPVVRMAYGTAETGLLAYETEPGAGLQIASGVLVQVCDLASGRPVEGGAEGQVVITLLRPEYPLVRFGTGDLSAWIESTDSRPRLAGVLGRVGEAVKVRGMFLHPRQAEATLGTVSGLTAYRFVVDRVEHRDELRVEVVPANGVDGETLSDEVRSRVRLGLRFDAAVAVVRDLPADGPVVVDARDWS